MAMTETVGGELAPDQEVTLVPGGKRMLSSLWAERPLVLAFLPSFHSPFLADNAAQLRDAQDAIEKAGADLVAVVVAYDDDAATKRENRNLRYPLIPEPHASLNRAFKLDTRGEILPASFVIATDGTIAYRYEGQHISDYPPTMALLEHVCKLTGARFEPPPVPAYTRNMSQPLSTRMDDDAARRASFNCIKCGGMSCDVAQISAVGGWLSRIFNFQYRRFSAISCNTCGYTELYKKTGSMAANIADILTGS
jgi:uncharacterized protein